MRGELEYIASGFEKLKPVSAKQTLWERLKALFSF